MQPFQSGAPPLLTRQFQDQPSRRSFRVARPLRGIRAGFAAHVETDLIRLTAPSIWFKFGDFGQESHERAFESTIAVLIGVSVATLKRGYVGDTSGFNHRSVLADENKENTMKNVTLTVVCMSVLGLSACENLTSEQRTVAGVAGGAAAGLIAAEALGANKNWRLISALGGAAAGTLVAQNQSRKVCAYARGNGTYYEAPCP